MANRILAIDDELDFLDSIKRGLLSAGFKNLRLESDPQKVADFLEEGEGIDVALIDVTMPRIDGLALLGKIKNISPNTECLMVTAVNEARIAVECLKKGAYDYLVKPISRDDLVQAVKRALERKRLLDILALGKKKTPPKLNHPEAFQPIITRSPTVLRLLKEGELHAASDMPVLITGENGTGKELLARAIHRASPREKFPFTPINMASLSGNLFDAEFFGHTKGAFTGAEKERMGHLEHTSRGTLFLDEIGSLPAEFQGKLLRVLQEGEFIKLGTSKPQKTDIRVIAATNADLDVLMAKGMFRKDLYYRLKGAWLHLPPLRERIEDVPLLIENFLREFCKDTEVPRLEEEALSLLLRHNYPGNIRELRSIIQAAVNLAQGKPISPDFFPDYLPRRKPVLKQQIQGASNPLLSLAEVEKVHILKTYEATGRNKVQTAKILGIGLNTLRRRLGSLGQG
jgi:DNA-binding NtrC family response regulator